MNRLVDLALLLAVAGALALRLPNLDTRPLHNDEAVNAVKVTELWQQGKYAYDPDEYHGPTLHYFSLPFLWLAGPKNPDQLSDSTLRLVTVAFGAGLILLLLLFADGLGRTATIWAAVFTAISPAMVFYSRYFIHEMLLVFFSALTLGAGWRYWQTRLVRWAVVAGVGVGFMFATKETFVLSLAAMLAALVLMLLWQRPPRSVLAEIRAGGHVRNLGFAVLAALAVWLVLFTSGFTHWSGLADSIRTYLPWLKRAGGHSPHIHPWHFYFERLAWFHPARSPVWSEALILAFAAVGAFVSLFRRASPRTSPSPDLQPPSPTLGAEEGERRGSDRQPEHLQRETGFREFSPLPRFLTLYTIFLTLLYTAISYKTPWCLLGFFHGLILLAGIGVEAVLSAIRVRVARRFVLVVLVLLAVQLAAQAVRAANGFSADRRNPYVYAQTARDVLSLVQKVEDVAAVNDARRDTVVKVVAPGSDYWPLPWYLRRLRHIGWFDTLPDDPYAPLVITAARLDARLDEKSGRKWVMAGMFELRPGVFLELYVEFELWTRYVATLPRERD